MNERIHTESDRVKKKESKLKIRNSKLPPQAKGIKHVFIQ